MPTDSRIADDDLQRPFFLCVGKDIVGVQKLIECETVGDQILRFQFFRFNVLEQHRRGIGIDQAVVSVMFCAHSF